jgi:isochorismate pyruvate lyase
VNSSAPLHHLRKEIDAADAALIALLAKRMAVVDRIIAVKKAEGLPAAIPKRVEDVVRAVRAEALSKGFPPDIAEKLWRLLIAETIAYEGKALGNSASA